MADVLVRKLSDEDLAALDARAGRLGISRNEYLRRLVHRDVEVMPVTTHDLAQFAATFADLDDPEVMRGAWE